MLRRAGHARIQLAQVHLAGRLVGQEVELEVAAIALAGAAARPSRTSARARARAAASVNTSGNTSLPHQPPSYGVSSGNPVSSAISGPTRVPWRVMTPSIAHLARVDPLHHLDVVPDDLLLLRLPIALVGDEERRLPGVAVRRLHHEVVAEPRGARELHQRGVVVRATHGVRHARHARLVAELRRDDLRVQPVAQRGRRERHLQAELAGELLGLLVEHQERSLAARTAPADEVHDLLVPQQVVADLLDRAELARPCSLGTKTFGCDPSNES